MWLMKSIEIFYLGCPNFINYILIYKKLRGGITSGYNHAVLTFPLKQLISRQHSEAK